MPFLGLAVDYKKKIGFGGTFLIEPKPHEPTSHQYDFDAAACLNFLRTYGLLPHFKLNLETNHATLAGHSMAHEMRTAREANALGSVDANTGELNGQMAFMTGKLKFEGSLPLLMRDIDASAAMARAALDLAADLVRS